MQIPILHGIYTDVLSEVRTAYPRNLMPVSKDSGVSEGYLRQAEGIRELMNGTPGIDRGAIEWRGVLYRVMGNSFCSVDADGNITVIGSTPGSDHVRFDYSFDRLAFRSSGNLYLYNGTTLQQVYDSDLGVVRDFLWVDGYFLTTDGNYLIVTELNNPFSVDPLKYGSSEYDPDEVMAVLKLRNEVYALNRHTIEAFNNVGGEGFPFQRIEGAVIPRGVVGTNACAVFINAIAFLGGGRNEPNSVWLGINGDCQKLSTKEIDDTLSGYSEEVLSNVQFETRVFKGSELLYIHLPDQTIVYDATCSKETGKPVWFVLTSSLYGLGTYRARNFVWCYNKWIVGDTQVLQIDVNPVSSSLGVMDETFGFHYLYQKIGWEFSAKMMYNESRGAILHQLELVTIQGRYADIPGYPQEFNETSSYSVWTAYSNDGINWSTPRSVKAAREGETNKRIAFFGLGFFRSYRIQKFWGEASSRTSFVRLEAQFEPLSA